MKNKLNGMLQPVISAVLLLIAYIPTIAWMADRWFAKESYYGHGILIPLVSLYFVWERRGALKQIPRKQEPLGLFIVGFSLLLHIFCALLKIYFVSGFSFVLAIYGLILFFFGKQMSKRLLFPVFFLLAMIPLPLVVVGNLTIKLKLFAAQAATLVLNKIGFPSILDGSIIRMPKSFTSVGAPCSGLRSLISLLTLGVIFAYALRIAYWKKGLVLLLAVPIAIATNVMRIVLISMVNDLYGEKVAFGFFHDFSGFLVFAVAFGMLFAIGRILERKKK